MGEPIAVGSPLVYIFAYQFCLRVAGKLILVLFFCFTPPPSNTFFTGSGALYTFNTIVYVCFR